jgi:hypothetical protein
MRRPLCSFGTHVPRTNESPLVRRRRRRRGVGPARVSRHSLGRREILGLPVADIRLWSSLVAARRSLRSPSRHGDSVFVEAGGAIFFQQFLDDALHLDVFALAIIDQSDEFLYVSSEQSSANATSVGNAFHTLKVAPDGTLTEPFSPTVLPIVGSVPVRAQGISVFGTK